MTSSYAMDNTVPMTSTRGIQHASVAVFARFTFQAMTNSQQVSSAQRSTR